MQFVRIQSIPFGPASLSERRKKAESDLKTAAQEWLRETGLTEIPKSRRIDYVAPDGKFGRDPSVTIYLEAESS